MQRPKPGNPSARPDGDAKASSLRSRAADNAWIAQDRMRAGTHEGLDRLVFPLQKKLLWPLQDRIGAMGGPARALSATAAVVLAAGAGIGGLLLATSGGGEQTEAAPVAALSPAPAPRADPAPTPKEPAQPTLQGAPPNFKAAKQLAGGIEADPAKATVRSSPAAASSESKAAAAADSGSSSGADATAKAAAAKAADGPPAGPAAIAVARDFSDAFVVYETGGLDPEVRKAFGATATPELAKALLRRPPRLPANVEVPEAKVLNVVPGPSHGGVYSVSVSLLRVGVTSELRLDMEQLKGKEWRVTNVLG